MAIEQVPLRESKAEHLLLQETQRDRLIKVGKSLASNSTWWGAIDEEEVERTVVSCEHIEGNLYKVTVKDAVGVIGLPGLSLTVHPKVPLDHFLYLLQASEGLPRFDKDAALAHPEASFWELVASWFVDAAERLLRLGLVKDYRESADVLPIARGRIRPIATARLYYAGRVAVDCEFDEFDLDNALNRLIKAAAVAVVGSPLLERELRRRAARVVWMLDDVSDAHIPDLRVVPDLRAAHYREPVDLAKRVLLGQGVAPKESESAARTFLVRTPDLIEGGIRNILANGLAEHWGVERKPHGRQISGSPMTLNPDLVFTGAPVTGDVKYKLPKKWDRGDLYQAVVFATGFKATRACVIHFEQGHAGSGSSLPKLKVGDLEVTPFAWNFGDDVDPGEASAELVAQLSSWLGATSEGQHPTLPGLAGAA